VPGKKIKTSKIQRLTQIGSTLAKVTGKYLIKKTLIKTGRLKSEETKGDLELKTKISVARDIIQSMGELKGALMKMGQMLSITEDFILPPEVSTLFKELQQNAPPMPRSDLDGVFIKSFGKIPEGIFKSFDRVPVAAASIGQVHKAVLPSGENVAVKVQYPNILKATESDFENLDKIKNFFGLLFPGAVDVSNLVREMKESLLLECDYERERTELVAFKELLKEEFPAIKVPKTFNDFSSKMVLTMEFMEGDSFEKSLEYPQDKKDRLGQLLFDAYMYTLFGKKKIHSDPQNGNYFFTHEGIKLMDFGSTKEFSYEFVKTYAAILLSIEDDDFGLYRKSILQLGIFHDDDSHDIFERHFQLIKETYSPYTKEGCYPLLDVNPFQAIKIFLKTIDLRKRKFPREELVLLDRSTLGVFFKLKKWKSNVNWVDSMKKYRGPIDLEIRDESKV
jgi:aarF domain-containing kinase